MSQQFSRTSVDILVYICVSVGLCVSCACLVVNDVIYVCLCLSWFMCVLVYVCLSIIVSRFCVPVPVVPSVYVSLPTLSDSLGSSVSVCP